MNSFYGELKKYALAEQEKFESEYEKNQESEIVKEFMANEDLLDLMLDKDNLITHLDNSKENVGQKIEEKDNEIYRAILDDWQFTSKRIEAVSYTHLTLPTICSV